jgi:hypothetical protein
MAEMCVAPDLVGSLRPDQLERNGTHRRNRGELDETLGFRVTQLRCRAGEGFEASHEKSLGSLAAGFFDHRCIFATASDGPPDHPVPGT